MNAICRVCLNVLRGDEISFSIFNYDEKDENIGNHKKIYIKIMELTGIIIVEETKDKLPKEICKKCYGNLSNSYDFRNLCKISDEALKKQYDVIKKENTDWSDIEISEKFDVDSSDIKKEKLGSEDITESTNKLQKLHIDPLTQNDFKPMRGYFYTFSTKLQNEFVEDFEKDADYEYLANCRYCKVTISVKYKGRLSLVKHLKSQKHIYLKYICSNDKNRYSKNLPSNEFECREKKRKLSIKSTLSSDILTDISDYEPPNDFSSEEDSDDKLSNESKTVSRKRFTEFNQSLQEEFKDNFISTKSTSDAFCIFCKTTVSVKYKGRCSLTAHITSKKHQTNLSDLSQLESELSPKKEECLEVEDQWLDISKTNDENYDFEILSDSKTPSFEKNKLKKSKRRYCKFNLDLQEKMKNDFEPVEGSDYEAFCKTCKTKISMKKGSLCLLRHLQTRKHLNITHFEPKGKNLGQIIKKTFICEHCGNIYDNRRRYRDHVELHSDIKRFKCEICEKEFRTSPQLKAHMRTHTGEKPFQCSFCGLRFSDLSTRTKHERIHTDERPYGCDTCGKSFRTSNTRREHVRIHTGEKPYSCNVCDLQFSRKYHLTQHCNSKIHQSKARAIKTE